MRKVDKPTKLIQKTLTLFLVLFTFLYANQTYAKGRAVDTWYKIKAKGFSKTVKAKKITLIIPSAKYKEGRARLLLDNRTILLKLGQGTSKLVVTAHGFGAKPTARSATSTTSTTTNGDVTITTTTTIDDSGNSKTKTTRTSSSGTTTTTTSTDSSGNTSTSTTSTNK